MFPKYGNIILFLERQQGMYMLIDLLSICYKIGLEIAYRDKISVMLVKMFFLKKSYTKR